MSKSKTDLASGSGTKKEKIIVNDGRRKIVQSVIVGSGTLIAGYTSPHNWTKPIVDSVLLPVHAQTSQITPPVTTQTFFTNSGIVRIDGESDILAKLFNVTISSAHAQFLPFVVAVTTSGSSAFVQFLSSFRDALFTANVPLDGTSIMPTWDSSSCWSPDDEGGPCGVRLVDFTPGDTSVTIEIQPCANDSRQVTVPEGPIGSLELEGCGEDNEINDQIL